MGMATMTAQAINGPEAWRSEELARSTDWIREIPPAVVQELETALRAVQRRGLAWPDVRREDFVIPAGARFLADVSQELEHGRGAVLLRRLPVERFSEEELKQIYWGLGLHLGSPRCQNAHGELIGEVRDEVRRYGDVHQPAVAQTPGAPVTSRYKARSNGPLRFHTDRADVVVLLCVRKARAGGISKVVSTVTIYNEILQRRPDLHALLCQDYVRTREGEEAGGERKVYALPVFGVRDGRFTSQYSRTFVEAAQRLPGVPPLSVAQNEALDLLAEAAEEQCFRMTLEPGDIQLLNNHVIYHGRTAYEDDDGSDSDRLLYRLWLSMPNSRALPPGFEVLWGSIEAGVLRGGIEQPAHR
jgi:Taurine catabolism dioxygenase TauD, TfdA family